MAVCGAYAPALVAGYVYEDRNDRASLLHPVYGLDRVTRVVPRWTFHRTGTDPMLDHAVNLGVHLVNTLLVGVVLSPYGLPAQLAGMGIFGLHPVQTEAVAGIANRSDLLVVTGLLVALCGVRVAGWTGGLLILLGAALSAASKEVGLMTLPLAALWRSRTGSAVPAGVWWVGALLVGPAVFVFGTQLHWPIASVDDIARHLAMYWRLLLLVIWPFGLSVDHNWHWLIPFVASYGAFAWLALAYWAATHRPLLPAFVVGWLLLAPLPRLLADVPEPLHEHHLYGPMVGLALALGLWVSMTPKKLTDRPAGWARKGWTWPLSEPL